MDDFQTWLYEMQAQDNTEVQQEGVPTTSQRTEELKQYMEAALRGPQRIVICKIYVPMLIEI